MERGVAQRLSRGRRRLLVLAIYIGLVAYTTTALIEGNSWWITVGLLGAATTVVIHGWLLLPFTQKIADKEESDLDERQVDIRNRAHRKAYQILGSVVIAALLYMNISLDYFGNPLWTPAITDENVSTVLIGTIWLVITLPTSIIAWNEPGPEESEEEL